ncbi:glycine/D-amino acid oxidase-like deaminating enzyme [Nonomuraea muscovyensis]|uniref:Glycine/D-amino acid oxidase-like deaminating enzyme n=1 Tax=Nonomuraea muscovyensis TaxID=1124761 RepID=A0A7X0C264_9ACTN|nr:FAD-dependent oxidoreductase [Nonomuraea muscovyensis]MBB6345314.1 glycine/D-amino acid oxidase-like deaminating enzyme [Nonomuraea muscovyensis]
MKSVIVVGAGIWGSSLALRLAETGWKVTLVEQHQPGHVRQASAGETRLLRCSHGGDDWYARMAWQAREGWRRLGERAGEELYHEAGMMWFAGTPDGWESTSARVLKNLDIPCEVLDPADGARFFPEFRGDDLSFLLWEPHAGVIRARRATQVTARLAAAAGVRLMRARAVPVPGADTPYGCAVDLGGEVLRADRVVWACGAWLPELFDLPLTVTKQDTLHFAVPPAWTTPGMPAWVDYGASAYGHGDVDGVGAKATSDAEGGPYEPEHGERVVDAGSVERIRGYLRRRFPSLATAPVLFSQVCQYALTPDAEWIIAEASPGVWLLGGDSGHGFKHAPALAAYVAGVLGGDHEPEARFGLHERLPSRGLRTSGEVR